MKKSNLFHLFIIIGNRNEIVFMFRWFNSLKNFREITYDLDGMMRLGLPRRVLKYADMIETDTT